MGPYLFAGAALTGFFLFGSLYHFILWSRARRNWTLLFFAIVALLSGVNSYALVKIATADTITTAQWALNLRGSSATTTVVFMGWLFGHITGFRARRVMWPFTFAFAALFIHGLFTPLAGVVTAVDRVITPWGESMSVLRRESMSPFLVPAYAFALAAPVIGVVGGAKLWARDRVGGVLTILTAVGYFTIVVLGFAIDTRQVSLPYLGALVSAFTILPIAWQVARANQQQAAQLVATERRFRAIFDQTFQFIGLLDVDGTLLEANQTALGLLGLRSQDVIGKPFWETPWWTHSLALQERLRQSIRAAARGEVVRFEVTHPDRDGQIHHVDFSLKPVHDSSGAVVLLIPEGRDITNRVLAEEEKRQLEQQLLQAQKMEALGQLAGGVAHDFNNLLTVIAGHTDMLLAERNEPPAHHDLEQIRQASDRAASMTRQLLAFSRQSVLEPKVVKLNALVSEIETMLRRSIGEDIELVVRSAPDAHYVKGDPDQLGRALLNMAINARDAMPDGGTLTIEMRNVNLPDQVAATAADAGTTPLYCWRSAIPDAG